jgi:hypothetical protein
MIIFGVIGAGLCDHAAHAAAPTECFGSAAAVYAAHPNAAHVSYTLRVKRSERCWYADAFNSEANAKAKPAPHTVARTSEARPAITAQAPQARATAVEPAEQPRSTVAVAPAPRPRIPTIAHASLLVTVPFPSGTPPSIQIVNAQELSRLLPVEETPADFESRFSASGYKVSK